MKVEGVVTKTQTSGLKLRRGLKDCTHLVSIFLWTALKLRRGLKVSVTADVNPYDLSFLNSEEDWKTREFQFFGISISLNSEEDWK